MKDQIEYKPEPVLIKAGSSLIRLGENCNQPPKVDCRVLAEDYYQMLVRKAKACDRNNLPSNEEIENQAEPKEVNQTLREHLQQFDTEQEKVSLTLFNVYPEEMAFVSRLLNRKQKRLENLYAETCMQNYAKEENSRLHKFKSEIMDAVNYAEEGVVTGRGDVLTDLIQDIKQALQDAKE